MTTAIVVSWGGGKTAAFVYHLSHMVARQEWRVLAADLNPRASLSAAFFDDEQLERFWDQEGTDTVATALGGGRIPVPQEVDDRLWVLPGDLRLSRLEDRLSASWALSRAGDEAALRTTTAFHRILQGAAAAVRAHVVFVDVGPSLGAINRAAFLACDALLVPLAPDLFSLHGLRILGPALRQWRDSWQRDVLPNAPAGVATPEGACTPSGTWCSSRRPDWTAGARITTGGSAASRRSFTARSSGSPTPPSTMRTTRTSFASLRSFTSLMPLARDARKPMFDLKPADGAMGSTGRLVHICYREFRDVAVRLMGAAEIPAASLS